MPTQDTTRNNAQAKFDSQFSVDPAYYLRKLDFVDWYRYYFILREVLNTHPKRIFPISAPTYKLTSDSTFLR